jgi:methylthioribose-1-phosphate isomerase
MRKPEVKPLKWTGNSLLLLDQRALPFEEVWIECTEPECVADAIEKMVVRGAPAIGVTASYGVVLGAKRIAESTRNFLDFKARLGLVINRLAGTRPTAVNLFWALKRMKKIADAGRSIEDIVTALETEARNIERQDIETNRKIGQFGAELLSSREVVLTYCNTGALQPRATAQPWALSEPPFGAGRT